MAYYLFVNNATFSWCVTLSQIVALNTTEAELMALASCSCDIVWARECSAKHIKICFIFWSTLICQVVVLATYIHDLYTTYHIFDIH